MNDAPTPERTEAARSRSRWPGWIWAIPIAALGIAGWLGVRAFLNQETEVKVAFNSVAGLGPDAEVDYRGLKVGHVAGLALADGGNRVVATLSLSEEVEGLLRTGTRFWIVGAHPGLDNLSALKSIVAGPSIAMDPGPGAPARRFVGLDRPPEVTTGADGTRFTLSARRLGALERGAPVHYLGLRVGTVTGTELASGGDGFEVRVFVQAPYDKLVRTTSRFWSESAIRVAMNSGGFEAKFASLQTVTSGAIAFGTPHRTQAGPRAATPHAFVLYPDKSAAEVAPVGPVVRYVIRFDGAAGDLEFGAPVKLRGFRIGRVVAVDLDYDTERHTLETPVTIAIDPMRLGLKAPASADGKWRPVVDDIVRQLIAQGLRGQLSHSPPVVGAGIVALRFVSDAPPAGLVEGGPYPEIPASAGGGIATLSTQAGDVLRKLQDLPLGKIAADLRATADRVRKLAGSREIDRSLDHLDSALANIDDATAAAHGRVGPILDEIDRLATTARSAAAQADHLIAGVGATQGRSLPAAIAELTRAARAVRELADYLDRHPEAIVKGRQGG